LFVLGRALRGAFFLLWKGPQNLLPALIEADTGFIAERRTRLSDAFTITQMTPILEILAVFYTAKQNFIDTENFRARTKWESEKFFLSRALIFIPASHCFILTE